MAKQLDYDQYETRVKAEIAKLERIRAQDSNPNTQKLTEGRVSGLYMSLSLLTQHTIVI